MLIKIGRVAQVNADWLMFGNGQPRTTLGKAVADRELTLPVAKQLLPGLVDAYRNLLHRKRLPVLHRDYAPTRFWYSVESVDQMQQGLMAGDLLLMESGRSWLHDPKNIENRWCADHPWA